MTSERVLTAKQAAGLARVTDSTIKRDCRKGRYPGAAQTAEGEWRIPIGDLERSGRWSPPPAQDSAEAADLAAVQAALAAEKAAHADTAGRLAVVEALLDAERRHNAQLLAIVTGSRDNDRVPGAA